jgi:maleylacetoacetate isomerase
MKLYTYFRSSAVFRVRIALNLKAAPYETVTVDIRPAAGDQHKPGYRALNPQGLVPSLATEGATLSQSLAIIEYLEEKFPAPPLLPPTPLERAQVRSMALAVACDIHPLNNLRVTRYLHKSMSCDQEALDAWSRHWIDEGFGALEAQAVRLSADGQHMFGSSVTLADIVLVPQMYNARRLKCDLAPYPTLRAISAHLETLPAFARAAPEAQPDAS